MLLEPASQYPWRQSRRNEPRKNSSARRLHRVVFLAVFLSIIVHVLLIFLFKDISMALPYLKRSEPLAFQLPRTEIPENALKPARDTDLSNQLAPEAFPDMVEDKPLDLTEIQDKIPDDREIAITPAVKNPENIAPGSPVTAGQALESLNPQSLENSLESLTLSELRVPDISPAASENQPVILADPEGGDGAKTRDLLELAAKGNEGLSDKFTTLDALMGIPGGKLTDINKPIYMPSDLLFEFNEDRLREGAKTSLMMLGILIDRNPGTRFIIEGHTDTIGTEERNLDLSRRRAEAVANWLKTSLKIAPERLEIVAAGESRPLVSPDGDLNTQQPNRRVEIRMRNPEGTTPPAAPPQASRPSVLAAPLPAPVDPPDAPAPPAVRPARPIAEPDVPVARPARIIEP